MGLRLQIIIAFIIIIGIIYIVNLIRKNRLDLKYALSWLIISVLVLILDCFPKLMANLADLFGIASPVNMMFFFGFLFILVIILTLTVALSINAGSVKRLNQKVAMLDKQVRELQKRDDTRRDE